MKTNLYRIFVILVTILIVLVTIPDSSQAAPPAQGPSTSSDAVLLDTLNQQTDGDVRISYHTETGKVRFIGTTPDRAITDLSVQGIGISAEDAARGYMNVYGQLFGLSNQSEELVVIKTSDAEQGRSFVRFQQNYRDIPVATGELIVQMDAGNGLLSITGEILPDLNLDTTPTISAEAARQQALEMVAKVHDLNITDLTTTEPELWIYNPALLGGPGLRIDSLVWRMEVTPVDLIPINELVFVDAHQGFVALHFNQIDTGLNRWVYSANGTSSLPGTLLRAEGDSLAGDTDADNIYNYLGDTYNFYQTYNNRDSFDNAGGKLVTTVHYDNGQCPNAWWRNDLKQALFCDGMVIDDVVAHEVTHGVTRSESNLYYYYQSGAINESLSDIWGEFVDFTNGRGDDSAAVRWLVGEDSGAWRNMKDPPAYNHPDKMTSNNYYCGTWDNGGVHTNSGVGNKLAYLITDGGSFNGVTITGLGIQKAATIFYETQTNWLTSGSDYMDLYDDLYYACTSLIGTNGITGSDCFQVDGALFATETYKQPTNCAASHASICPVGQEPSYLFYEDFESSNNNWGSIALVGNDEWYWPVSWYAANGTGHLFGWDQNQISEMYIGMNPDITLPAGNTSYLHFSHAYDFEYDSTESYDGGTVGYSIDGGNNWHDVQGLGTTFQNGYNGTLSNCCGNPRAGDAAFVGVSNGYISSRLDLGPLAGQNVRFSFGISTDQAQSDRGWYIDDVRIYTCSSSNNPPWWYSSALPDQFITVNNSRNNAIDLWHYVQDYEDIDQDLTFSITNTPDPNAGVSIDGDRYIDINPTFGWTGKTTVEIQVQDTNFATVKRSFEVTVDYPNGYIYSTSYSVMGQAYIIDTDHLNGPYGLIFDGSDNLFVAEERGGRIIKFDSSGNTLFTIGKAGMQYVDANVFDRPTDVVMDSSGNIWVVDQHRITKYDSNGNFMLTFPDWDKGPWASGSDNEHFDTPLGLAFDSGGRLYVADTENNRIQVYNVSGGTPVYHRTITGFNRPHQMVFDNSGRLYVADTSNFRIQRCTFFLGWSCSTFHGTGSYGSGSNEVGWVTGLGLKGNTLYITDGSNDRIKQCDINSGSCSTFVSGGFNWPGDVAVDSSGNVYVSDTDDFVIKKYNSSGSFLGIFAGDNGVPYLTDQSRFNAPHGIAIDNSNNIYIGTERGFRLLKLASNGVAQWTVGQPGVWGNDNAHFGDFWAGPRNIAVGTTGKVYVADEGNHRVQIFNSNGSYSTTLGSYGSGNYQFDAPRGVAVDNNGNIYVADTDNHRIQVFNSSLTYIGTLGQTGVSGSDNAHFDYPKGVTVDSNGNIYVADSINNRVQVFNSSWIYVRTLGTTGDWGNDNTHFSQPYDIAVDNQGKIFVADAWNNRVQVFYSTGDYVTSIGGSWGDGDYQFRDVLGVDVDADGSVYIADSENHRIQKFVPVVVDTQNSGVYLPIVLK